MKKIFFIIAFIATTLVQTSFVQENSVSSSDILTQYYAVKEALVSGNPNLANTKAIEFVKTATDVAILPEANRVALVKDASNIAKTKDLKKQREYFSAFSENMSVLAKSIKLSTQPVYKAYCPMVKASWLSNASSIKNPYYGSAMLTCGKVVETIK